MTLDGIDESLVCSIWHSKYRKLGSFTFAKYESGARDVHHISPAD